MENVHRQGIETTLSELPRHIKKLFLALRIPKLASLLGRESNQLTDNQLQAIDTFFAQVRDHQAAIRNDAKYSTGEEDDLARVSAGLPEPLRQDIERLPEVCLAVGKLFVERLAKKLEEQLEHASTVDESLLPTVQEKLRKQSELGYEEARLTAWIESIAVSDAQIGRIPREYCSDELKRLSSITTSPAFTKWQRCSEALDRDALLEYGDFARFNIVSPLPAFAPYDLFALFPDSESLSASDLFDMLCAQKPSIEPQSRFPETWHSLKGLVDEAFDASDGRYDTWSGESVPDREARLEMQEEFEKKIAKADEFLGNKAIWWALEHGPFDFELFYRRKNDLRKYDVPADLLRKAPELPILLREIQTAFCFDRPATVAALSRATLERIMHLHGYKNGLGKYKDDVRKLLEPIDKVEGDRVQAAVTEIHKFGNDVLHANQMKQPPNQAEPPHLRSLKVAEQMKTVCTTHLPTVIEILLPQAIRQGGTPP